MADAAEVIRAHERGDDFGWARGRPVSAFDHFAGQRATEGLGQLGDDLAVAARDGNVQRRAPLRVWPRDALRVGLRVLEHLWR